MITLTDRDRLIILALLFRVPVLWEWALSVLWPDTDAGRENMRRRLAQLRGEGLLARHVATVPAAPDVSLFYHWAPGLPAPNFGALAWRLAGRWEAIEPRRVVVYTATEFAARHYGRVVRGEVKPGSLAHDIGLGQVFLRYAVHDPLLAGAWVAEEVVAASRSYGEKVVDAVLVDSASTPALAVEFAGASYAASNGERLREIHRDCALRGLPYEVWTVSEGENR